MPVVSLRMSDEEHDLLRRWAAGSRRSMQREIIFRLFSGAVSALVVGPDGGNVGSAPVETLAVDDPPFPQPDELDESPRKKDFLEDRFGPLKRNL